MTAHQPSSTPTPHPIDRLYRFLVGDRVLAALIALVALAVTAGLLLPQTPDTLVEPDSATRWLAETSRRYGAVGGILQSGGFFDLWNSFWFHALVAVVAFVLLLRLGFVIGDAGRRLRHPDVAAALVEAPRWPLHATFELDGDVKTASVELGDDLRKEGWHVTTADAGAAIVAERSRWGLAAIPVFYAGLLIALAGLWLGQITAWRETGLALLPDQPVALRHDNRLSISLAGESPGQDTIMVQASDGASATGSFSASGRVRLAGLAIRRTGLGQALTVAAREQDGEALQLQSSDQPGRGQSSLQLVFDQPRVEQVFYVPSRELVVSIVAFPALPERGFAGPTFLIQAFQAGQREPVFNQFVEGDTELAVANDVFQLRSGNLIAVDVSRNPASPLVIAGGVLALAGMIVALWRPAGRLALSVQRAPGGPAHSGKRSAASGVRVEAGLAPAPLWRQAGRWLVAWTSAYELHSHE